MTSIVARRHARLPWVLVAAGWLAIPHPGTPVVALPAAPEQMIPSSTGVVYKAQPADKAAVIQFLEALDRGDAVQLRFESRNAFRDAWDKVASEWVRASDVDRERRRRILALAILQAGYDALNGSTWLEIRWLIEWQCDQLRRGPTTEFEYVWLAASIALIQSAGDRGFLEPSRFGCDRLHPCDHAWHALSRFPEDREFRMARMLPVLMTKPFARQPGALLIDPRFGRPEFKAQLRETFNGLRSFVADPKVGPESRLRLGLLHYALNELPDCLRELDAAATSSDDAYVRYVAKFVTGLVHEAEGRGGEAIQNYEAALGALPNVRSGATWLAAKYFLAGRRDDAFALMDAVYEAPPQKIDPWHRSNELRGWRSWPGYFERLRELARR